MARMLRNMAIPEADSVDLDFLKFHSTRVDKVGVALSPISHFFGHVIAVGETAGGSGLLLFIPGATMNDIYKTEGKQ